MGQVIASASMSLDGYVAMRDNTNGGLVDRLPNRRVELPAADGLITFHSRPSFGELATDDAALGDPIECIQDDRVTRLQLPGTKDSTRGRG